jgi:rare lipoprotein A
MILKKIRLLFVFLLIKPIFLYSQTPILGEESCGRASYYATKFYGRKTASGEILAKEDLTCAHPTLPFGTMLEVTNLENNKWCVVRVNDRGPYTRNRILDVSHKAAAQLGMFKSGVAKVKVMIIGDHNKMMITRPESIIENSMELVNDNTSIKTPLKKAFKAEKSNKNKKVIKKKVVKKKKTKKIGV